MSSTRSRWSTPSASTRCATSSCGRCPSARTAATAKKPSSPGSMPTWPTSWATWPSVRCPWSTRTSTAIVPTPGEFSAEDLELLAIADGLMEKVRAAFDEQAMHQALEAIWLMLGAANRYFSAQEPWVLRKSRAQADQDRFRTVLYVTLEVVRVAALLVQPVMPASAAKLLDLLGQPEARATSTRSRRGSRRAPRCPRRSGCSRAIRSTDSSDPRHVRSTFRASGVSRGERLNDLKGEHVMTEPKNRIVVVGGGYAGVFAANHLRLRADVDVTLVNPRRGVRRTDPAAPAGGRQLRRRRRLCRDARPRHESGDRRRHPHRLRGPARRAVQRRTAALRLSDLRGGQRLGWCHGRRTRTNSLIPSPISSRPSACSPALDELPYGAPVCVVGAGPTGIETAAELAEQGRAVTLVCGPVLGPYLSTPGRRSVARRLRKLGVEIVDGPGSVSPRSPPTRSALPTAGGCRAR